MKKLALILALMIPATVARSEVTTGNQYYDQCRNLPEADATEIGWCVGFVVGAWEGISSGVGRALIAFSDEPIDAAALETAINLILGVCQPDGVTYGQMLDVFEKYLRENPANRNIGARTLLVEALSEAFPCE
ncbi:MAG: Rap1a/Tai family immunity protein [Roseobacter sp.]